MAERSPLKTYPVQSFWRVLLSVDRPWTGRRVGQAIPSKGSEGMRLKSCLTKFSILWKSPWGLLKSLWKLRQAQSLKKPHLRGQMRNYVRLSKDFEDYLNAV